MWWWWLAACNSAEGLWQDPDGYIWLLGWETAEPLPFVLGESAVQLFASADCSGPGDYVVAPLPRVVNERPNGDLVVRPDDLASSPILSIDAGAGCVEAGGFAGVRVADLEVVAQVPPVNWTPPLHREIR